MTAKFITLTDAELDNLPRLELLALYRDLRAHHIAEAEAHAKRDRSAILRMAGNIAGGMFADPNYDDDPAEAAVRIARRIVAEVDRSDT